MPKKEQEEQILEKRVHVSMTKDELEALDKYCEKNFPGAGRAYVIRLLIQKGIK